MVVLSRYRQAECVRWIANWTEDGTTTDPVISGMNSELTALDDLERLAIPCMAQADTDQQNSAVFDHVVSATGGVSILASPSGAHCSYRFVLCFVPERAIDWQISVSFAS